MRKKHLHFFAPVFSIATILLLGLFVITGSQSFADGGFKGKGEQKVYNKESRKHYERQARESQKYGREKEREARKRDREMNDRRDYKRRPDYRQHRGYRERPYDRNRQYGYNDYKGHRYNYEGHWRSWDQWDKYSKVHPEVIRHGEYYREDAHLMFRFRDPITGSSFFFSIGR